jgi:hypothetical protein
VRARAILPPLPAYVALARAAQRAGFDQLRVSDGLFA